MSDTATTKKPPSLTIEQVRAMTEEDAVAWLSTGALMGMQCPTRIALLYKAGFMSAAAAVEAYALVRFAMFSKGDGTSYNERVAKIADALGVNRATARGALGKSKWLKRQGHVGQRGRDWNVGKPNIKTFENPTLERWETKHHDVGKPNVVMFENPTSHNSLSELNQKRRGGGGGVWGSAGEPALLETTTTGDFVAEHEEKKDSPEPKAPDLRPSPAQDLKGQSSNLPGEAGGASRQSDVSVSGENLDDCDRVRAAISRHAAAAWPQVALYRRGPIDEEHAAAAARIAGDDLDGLAGMFVGAVGDFARAAGRSPDRDELNVKSFRNWLERNAMKVEAAKAAERDRADWRSEKSAAAIAAPSAKETEEHLDELLGGKKLGKRAAKIEALKAYGVVVVANYVLSNGVKKALIWPVIERIFGSLDKDDLAEIRRATLEHEFRFGIGSVLPFDDWRTRLPTIAEGEDVQPRPEAYWAAKNYLSQYVRRELTSYAQPQTAAQLIAEYRGE